MSRRDDRERRLSGGERRRPRKEREQKKKRSTVGKAFRILLRVLLALAAAGLIGFYAAGVVYFQDRFLFHTRINGFDVSLQTVEEVEQRIASQIAEYQLTIEERGGQTEVITAADINYHYVSKGETQTFQRGQNLFLWPLSYWKDASFTFESSAQYDEAMLNSRMESLTVLDDAQTVAPEDAYIGYLDGSYQVIAEVEGNRPKKDLVTRLIHDSVDFGSNRLSLEEKSCYLSPEKRQNDAQLNATCKTLNKYIGSDITYLFGEKSEQLNKETLLNWVSYDVDGNVKLDEDQVYEFVYQLASTYDSVNRPREFTTHSGAVVSVEGGSYGWEIDQVETAADLKSMIYNGYQGTAYAIFTQTAESWYNSDLGNSFIEIDLASQHVWMYIDGEEVVSTDCVSGTATDPKRYTPSGTYTIYYKESPSVLKGEMKSDGTPEYETKVEYWMPFNEGIGLHDASWRGAFGGSIYQTDGSHGCINLPASAAKEIYDRTYAGMPVIVYNS
ncbi:MAG: L,D-transpeptidase family protein [Eubacteriales bacterium]|nr:L,D-transpeptidase family protein [Eubacteriales bacterium]